MKTSDFINTVKYLGLPISDAYDIISYMLQIDYNKAKNIQNLPDDSVNDVLVKLFARIPTAYITNRREFYGYEFYVNEDVLIPRVETEVLVNTALEKTKNINNPKILDLCTGSGCILISYLAERTDAIGTGVDISDNALKVARKNASALNVNNRISFIKADAASYFWEENAYDVILCNPPYISENEYITLDVSVMYEPKIALTAKEDGLFFYKNILMNANILCKKKGTFIFEIGYNIFDKLVEFTNYYGIKAKFINDYSGVKRVMVCDFNK